MHPAIDALNAAFKEPDPFRRHELFLEWKRKWYDECHVICSVNLDMPVNADQLRSLTNAHRKYGDRTLGNTIAAPGNGVMVESVRDMEPDYHGRPTVRQYLKTIAVLRHTPKE